MAEQVDPRPTIEAFAKQMEAFQEALPRLVQGEELRTAAEAIKKFQIDPQVFARFESTAKALNDAINAIDLSALAKDADKVSKAFQVIARDAAALESLFTSVKTLEKFSDELDRLKKAAGAHRFSRSDDHVSIEAAETLKVG